MEDVVIIGGGIIGCCIAYELSHYQLQVTLLEKNNDVADEVSMANSAIVHAGYDPEDDTLKALLNLRGARLMKQWCEALMVDYEQCGAFVAACTPLEEETLMTLHERALRRGIRSKLLNRNEALILEPNLSDEVSMIMDVPQTAIITPWNVAIAAMETAMDNGVKLCLNSEVKDIVSQAKGYVVKTDTQSIQTRYVINAAGLYADKIYQLVSKQKHFEIKARKGEYFVLSKDVKGLVSRVIYPTPSKIGKGVLAVPTIHGNLLIGPNRSDSEIEDHGVDQEGLALIKTQIQHTLKAVPWASTIRIFSGLRPSGNHGDFYIKEESQHLGFINVACIDSPGIASAPGIAQYVREIIEKSTPLRKRINYQQRRKPIIMDKLTMDEKQKVIERNASFGHIVCRCEKISEGEIIDIINRPCGARSIKAVKKRMRAGMGKCQGGFCEPLVTKILSETLHVKPTTICYDQADTPLFVGHTKEGA